MQITTFTDFSLRTLIFLAQCPEDKYIPVAEIGKFFNMTKNHLIKVVQNLVKLGYVESTRGPGGGIRLLADPTKLFIGSVIRSTEPCLNVLDCNKHPCVLSSNCFLKGALDEATEAFLAVLDKNTLSDVIDRQRKTGHTPRHPLFA